MSEEQTKTTSEDLMRLAQANNYLAVHLHRLLAQENKNVFFSPFSISNALAMLLSAAEGNTASEMSSALGYDSADIKREDVASVFEQEMSLLLKNSSSYTLTSANSMLSQSGFAVKDEYKKILADSFKALLLEVDFVDESEKAVCQINEWVKEKTNNMIPELLQSLDPSTVLVLLNAVYFKGMWKHTFEKNRTFPQEFYNQGIEDNAKEIDMMHQKKSFDFYEDEKVQVLQLPYIGEEVAMMILLPRAKDGLQSLEANLSLTFVQDMKHKFRKQKVEVTLPRFRLEYTKSLVSCFQKLGVKRVFSRGAELSSASDSQDLFVSEILHKAVLEVNEEGSEAAAATMVAVAMCCITFDPVFIADHPFVFVIYDTRNDLILFMGSVNEL